MWLVWSDFNNLSRPHLDVSLSKLKTQATFQNMANLLVVMTMTSDNRALFQEDSRSSDSSSVNHFSRDFRRHRLTLNVFPAVDFHGSKVATGANLTLYMG